MEIKTKSIIKFAQRLVNASIKPLIFLFLIQLNIFMLKPAIAFIVQ